MSFIVPEQSNQYFQQFRCTGYPNGLNTMGIPSDCVAQYQVTSAQLLALNATPITLVLPPTVSIAGQISPPNGFIFQPELMFVEYVAGTTAYTMNGTAPSLAISYVGQTTTLVAVLATGVLNQTVNTVGWAVAGGEAALANTVCANLGLSLFVGGTVSPSFTLGNGTVNITLMYNIIPLFGSIIE